jgi:hypothetical protein
LIHPNHLALRSYGAPALEHARGREAGKHADQGHAARGCDALAGGGFLVKEVQFGSDGAHLFVRVDFHQGYEQELLAMEVRFTAIGIDSGRSSELTIAFAHGAARAEGIESVECALGRVLEIRIPLGSIGVTAGRGVRFQMSIWESGLPMRGVVSIRMPSCTAVANANAVYFSPELGTLHKLWGVELKMPNETRTRGEECTNP